MSVHKLRPGDIDVVAAIGDSLSAGTGALGKNLLKIRNENRGVAFSIGKYSKAAYFKMGTLKMIIDSLEIFDD